MATGLAVVERVIWDANDACHNMMELYSLTIASHDDLNEGKARACVSTYCLNFCNRTGRVDEPRELRPPNGSCDMSLT